MWAVFVASIFSGGTCWAAAREAKSGAPPGKVEGGASHLAFQWISRDGRGPRDGDAAMLKIRCRCRISSWIIVRLVPKCWIFLVKKLMEMGDVS